MYDSLEMITGLDEATLRKYASFERAFPVNIKTGPNSMTYGWLRIIDNCSFKIKLSIEKPQDEE